ncbi:MAG: adenylate/guanylate cyclase domain-containing protein [Reyranella sp.]|jgi:adenylate cyclase|nr:MAG: adenylate/guanylate cyclase domain-containing protein [Reyranella sp.]
MDEETSFRVYVDPLARWFVAEAFRITDTTELIKATGEQIVAAGIPLYRLAYFQRTLHPEFSGKGYFWRRGRGIEVGAVPHGYELGAEYRDNPLPKVYAQRKIFRYRLEGTTPEAPVLRQLQTEGATDYVALPLFFSGGHVDALSLVSDRPGGFTAADLDRLYHLHFAFTRMVEIHSLRDTAANLLDAYVGRAAGQRILAGEVKRGEGQSLDAVIWYCDLRGFTRASDDLPRDSVICLLNDYFGAMGAAVTTAGGEILKFMGDGMLAMLPVGDGSDRAKTAAAAVDAALEARRAVTALNAGRSETGQQPLRFGLALHIGEVMFGNIGASQRLDFTVIGPAVNYAARLEKACAATGRSIVLSQPVAELLPAGSTVALGLHDFKDIDQPQPVYGLAA